MRNDKETYRRLRQRDRHDLLVAIGIALLTIGGIIAIVVWATH